ncbi:transcription antitermination factor NusB [Croceivirga radicis]|uniref:Transcription antitermination factor NusB n=1 Tax=Croceivirga radicis TaxID=1929488 RepID=A0A1V6LPB0_9FLAO|nr:transcription antitermination factor NusB [Croceivirga radicis]OQD42034.1 transcription antitermination factor NusB [Croceivirga radicis]
MLTRRHIRVKVMQCIYALIQSKEESLEKQQKFLNVSIANVYSLYLLMLSLLLELRELAEQHVTASNKKYISDKKDAYPDKSKFVNNRLLVQLAENAALKEALEKRKLNNWYLNEEYVKIILKDITESEVYKKYMSEPTSSYALDKELIIKLYKEVIAPNDKIYEYFEDDKLTWVDDIPIVNTFIVKLLKKAKEDETFSYFLPKLLKDEQDMTYAKDLLSKTLLHNAEWESIIAEKTPKWDTDRIAEIDHILLKMAICEFLHFASIPEKVTINEYLEIAKEYSTPKSSIFINGILDKVVREFKETGKMQKIGRGLL